MKVLVTGADGFLGRHLMRLLDGQGHHVIGVVRNAARSGRDPGHFSGRTEILPLDLSELDFAQLPSGVETIYSLAQSSHFRDFPGKAEEIFQVNVQANLKLLQWARLTGVGRFILASSGGIYGTRRHAVMSETDLLAVDSPLGFYLGTKLCAEVLFQNYRHFFETAVIIRPFFIYGPGQRKDMLIPRLIELVKTGKPIQLQGPGGLCLNPVFVEDVAFAFVSATALMGCHVVNVAGPDVLTLREISELIGRRLGRAPVFEPVAGDPSDYVANTDVAKERLHLPQTPFAQGLAATIGQT